MWLSARAVLLACVVVCKPSGGSAADGQPPPKTPAERPSVVVGPKANLRKACDEGDMRQCELLSGQVEGSGLAVRQEARARRR